MPRLVLESVATITENAKISGIALIPRISRNGNLYTKEEMQRAHGVHVPLNWEHNGNQIIGSVTFAYNESLQQLHYSGQITDDSVIAKVKNKTFYTSIEATVESMQHICNSPTDCFDMPHGMQFTGLAITDLPGVPETSVHLTERFIGDVTTGKTCKHCDNISYNQNNSKLKPMTSTKEMDNTDPAKDCPVGQKMVDGKCTAMTKDEKKESITKHEKMIKALKEEGDGQATAGINQEKPSETPCPDGQKMVDGKCVPADNKPTGVPGGSASFTTTTESSGDDCGCGKKTKAKETALQTDPTGHGMPNQDDVSAKLKALNETLAEVKTRLGNPEQVNELEAMQRFNEKLYNKTVIGTETNGFKNTDLAYIAKEGIASLKKFKNYSFDVDLTNQWVKEHVGSGDKIREALSYSGDPSNKVAVMDKIYVLPGGKYLKSIRDLVRFYDVPDGTDQIKLIKGNIPNAQAITEGTDNAAGTNTLTTRTLAADTVTGFPQEIKQADLEDTPQEIFSYLAETARGEVLEHEATLVFDTVGGKAYAVGGNDVAGNPRQTIKGDGTNISSDTASPTDASNTDADNKVMSHKAIAAGLQYFEEQGYDTTFGNIKLALHPKALRELRTSTELVRFVQQGDAEITKTGRLTHLYGVELIPMNAVPFTTSADTNNTVFQNTMFVGGHTFALASKRELTIDLQKRPKRSAFDWTWTQRKNATYFDEASWVRVLSTNNIG